MFINKGVGGKKSQKIKKKKSKSKRKFKKLHHQQSEDRPPRYHNSTSSLLTNHNASQFSLISEHKNKKSLSKNLKPNRQSSAILHQNPTKFKKKQKKSVCQRSPKKQSPPRLKQKDEAYERIILGQYNSRTNSEINFSSNPSSRYYKNKKNLTIECSDEYILSQYLSNTSVLPNMNDHRRNQAAVKIQKVFRGFLTRKMLQNFIEREEAKLQQLSAWFKISTPSKQRKRSSPIKLSSENERKINFSSDFLFDEGEQQPIKQNQLIDHGPLDEESSISGGNPDSLSKYLPEQQNFINDDETTMIKKQELESHNFQQKNSQPRATQTTKKIEQPLPTDFSEKYIPEFGSYSSNRNQWQFVNSIQSFKENEKKNENFPKNKQKTQKEKHREKQKQSVKILKRREQEKWGKIIEMLNEHILKSHQHSSNIENFMKLILDYSRKNKEELEKSVLIEPEQKQSEIKSHGNMINLLKEESLVADKIRKNEDMPLMMRKNIKQMPSSIFEKTEELKKYLRKTLTHYPVSQMIQIRQKALEKRQKDMVNKLNEDLQTSTISHDKFLERLAQMQEKFQLQKQTINRTKLQIFMGNQAVNKLVKDSFLDAKYLGFNIPFSQSMKDIKNNNSLWIKEIVVDQLRTYSKTHSKICPVQLSAEKSDIYDKEEKFKESFEESHLTLKQSESQSIEYLNEPGQQELSYNQGAIQNRHYVLDTENLRSFEESFHSSSEDSDIIQSASKFRRVSPRSGTIERQGSPFKQSRQELQKMIMDKISVNRNPNTHGVFNQLKQYEDTSRNNKLYNMPKSEVFNVSFESSEDEEVIFDEEIDPTINQITQQTINKLIWQITGDIFENSHIWRKLYQPQSKNPTQVSQEQRVEFLEKLYTILPDYQDIKQKLNQKMVPSKLELLKFMRVELEDETERSEDSQFEQIGKFELVFPPEMCLKGISRCIVSQQISQQLTVEEIQIISNSLSSYALSPACIRKVLERQKFRKYSENQRRDLKVQINKIQFHCIFDALNQTILKLHSKSYGYSGIGLNELSLLFYRDQQEQNRIHDDSQVSQILQATKKEIKGLIASTKTTNQKLIMENYGQLCKNDSMWIKYSDEALSFAMQLVFMFQDTFFIEQTEHLRLVLGRQ